jgi:hypothetical protein
MTAPTEAAERFTAVLDGITTLSPADKLVVKLAAQEYAAALVEACARSPQWGSRAEDGAA